MRLLNIACISKEKSYASVCWSHCESFRGKSRNIISKGRSGPIKCQLRRSKGKWGHTKIKWLQIEGLEVWIFDVFAGTIINDP